MVLPLTLPNIYLYSIFSPKPAVPYGSSVLQLPAVRYCAWAEERANDERAAEVTSLQAEYNQLQAEVTDLSR